MTCRTALPRSAARHAPAPRLLALLLALALVGVGARPATADQFFVVDLQATGGEPLNWMSLAEWAGFVRVSQGDLHLERTDDWGGPGRPNATTAVLRLPDGVAPAAVELVQLQADRTTWRRAPLADGAVSRPADAEVRFHRARARHYGELVERQLPGGALFRAERDAALARLDATMRAEVEEAIRRTTWSFRRRGFDRNDTLGLFSGGRALQENLQLDQVLAPADGAAPETVALDTLEAVTVAEIDWAPYLAGMAAPELDPLAGALPADNAAAFFPDFDALVRVVDAGERLGNPVADAAVGRATSEETRRRLEAQLGVSLDGLARALGAQAVGEVAATADDLYLLDGTGVALLLRAKNMAVLRGVLAGAHAAARQADPDVRETRGTAAGGVAWSGVANPARSVSSFVATLGDDVVVVANSQALLERIARTRAGEEPAIGALDEYRFFRGRYPRGAEQEDAFVLMTDAAIRKWTGPRWRIGQSRRVRAAAALADMTVAHRDEVLAGGGADGAPRTYPTAWVFTGPTEVALVGAGFHHRDYGSLQFLTPIAEMALERVTTEEAANYAAFRDRYQNRWTRFFDPIAVQARARGGLALDVTVMPLIAGSEYREMIDFTAGGMLAPDAGDPHAEALLHVIFHLNPEGREITRMQSSLTGAVPQAAMPMRWMSGALEAYVDADPLWDTMPAGDDSSAFQAWLAENWMRLPVALRIGSNNPLGLAAFLTALRTLSDGSAPGMLSWETKTRGEAGYVKVTARVGGSADATICYFAEPGGLTVSLREDLIERAVDRAAARGAGGAVAPAAWLGGSVAGRAEAATLRRIVDLFERPWDRAQRDAAFANLPILDEWRRRYPERDAVEVHRALFGTTLECPGGAGYRWNEERLMTESVALGTPWEPRGTTSALLAGVARAASGLTFEEDGLRAAVVLEEQGAE